MPFGNVIPHLRPLDRLPATKPPPRNPDIVGGVQNNNGVFRICHGKNPGKRGWREEEGGRGKRKSMRGEAVGSGWRVGGEWVEGEGRSGGGGRGGGWREEWEEWEGWVGWVGWGWCGVVIVILWCRRRDSNSRPTDYKSAALPTELRRRGMWNYTTFPLSSPSAAWECVPRSAASRRSGIESPTGTRPERSTPAECLSAIPNPENSNAACGMPVGECELGSAGRQQRRSGVAPPTGTIHPRKSREAASPQKNPPQFTNTKYFV